VDDGGVNLWSFPQATGTGLFGTLREAGLSSMWTAVCPGGLKKSLTAYGSTQPEWAEERRCSAGSMMPATMWQEGAVRLEFFLLADSIFLISSYQTWKPRHPLYSGTITCWWLQYVNSDMDTSQSSLAPLLLPVEDMVCCLLTVRHGGKMDPSPATNVARMHLLRNASIYTRHYP
jgi:hypothetical protein